MFSLVTSAAAVEQSVSNGGVGNLIAFLSALAALLSVAITSLRKRKDVSVVEMQARIESLEAQAASLNAVVQTVQTMAIARGRELFLLRNVLAENGLSDPTTQEGKRP